MSTPAKITPESQVYITAHVHASKHRAEVEASEKCACFFCFRKFAPGEITSWIEGGQTALCPKCGLDSVLGSASPLGIDDRFLRKMHQHHYAYRSK